MNIIILTTHKIFEETTTLKLKTDTTGACLKVTPHPKTDDDKN